MRPIRPVSLLVAALGGALLVGVSTTLQARARATRQDVPVARFLYRGEGSQGNTRLGSWGSGRADESREAVLIGESSIRITTHGLYQGGRIDFRQPIDLNSAFANPKSYVRLRLRLPSTGNQNGGFGGGPGGFGGPPGGFGGANDGGGGAPGGSGNQNGVSDLFERMRFLLIMADGSQHELIRPLDIPPTDDLDAYIPEAFPLAAVTKSLKGKSLKGDAAKLSAIVLAGDRYAQFHVGEIDILTDDTEISVNDLEEQIAFVNNDMFFAGGAEGGSSTLRFSWDWDDRDGIQEDAVGRSAYHVFTKTGPVVVTLTVSDVDGLKPPHSKSVKLEISQ